MIALHSVAFNRMQSKEHSVRLRRFSFCFRIFYNSSISFALLESLVIVFVSPFTHVWALRCLAISAIVDPLPELLQVFEARLSVSTSISSP